VFKKLKQKIKKIKQTFSNDKCYNDKVKEGLFESGIQCKGMVGGDRYSAYMCYSCIDCKHYIK
jgi:hypothetical protein